MYLIFKYGFVLTPKTWPTSTRIRRWTCSEISLMCFSVNSFCLYCLFHMNLYRVCIMLINILRRCKCKTMEICIVRTETSWRHNNSPSLHQYDCQKMAEAIVSHCGQKGTWFPLFKFCDWIKMQCGWLTGFTATRRLFGCVQEIFLFKTSVRNSRAIIFVISFVSLATNINTKCIATTDCLNHQYKLWILILR